MEMKEGHPAYRSQSDNPLQGTTLGGRPDDPRREHTRDAAAGDPPRGGGWRERGVPRSRDLADAVLSLAEQAHPVRGGRAASPAAARTAGAAARVAAACRTANSGAGDRAGHVGLPASGRLSRALVAPDAGAEHRAATAAAARPRNAARALARARAPQCAPSRLAHR